MCTNKPANVAIVGGGISGLAAAFYLNRLAASTATGTSRPLHIDLFEAEIYWGGKIRTSHRDGLTLELGAESFLSRKTPAIELCQQLGLASRLRGTNPANRKTLVWHRGKLKRLPAGLTGFVPGNMRSLFLNTLLSPVGKLRVAADFLLPAKRTGGDESLADFMTRRLGKQAYRRLVQPLLCGIYAGQGDQLSLAATYPELRSLEQQYGSLIRGLKHRQHSGRTSRPPAFPPFVTLPGGMAELVETLKRQLKNTQLRQNCRIEDCRIVDGRWSIRSSDRDGNLEARQFDALLITTPAFAAATMIQGQAPQLAAQLREIPHVSTATVNLWYDAAHFTHPLDGYGFVIPEEQQRGLTAVTWTSSKHFDRASAHLRLLRAYLGRAGAELDPDSSDAAILSIVQRELKRTMGIDGTPAGYEIRRWPLGSPQYNLGHLERLQNIERGLQRCPGLFLSGASYRGVGIPDCIRTARSTSEQVIHYLNQNGSNQTHAPTIGKAV